MAYDSTFAGHQEWLGYVQPVGVVVSTSALLEAGAAINRNFVPLHREFLAILPSDRDGSPLPELRGFGDLATRVLGWSPSDLQAPPDTFSIPLSGYEEVLAPTYVVRDGDSTLLLIQETALDFDADPEPHPHRWNASPQLRFERLLRETNVPAGLLVSPNAIRLVYAPKGESSGHITFQIRDMVQVEGRPILAALHMLLSAERIFTGPADSRLPALLATSRKHQNLVSTKLAGQVMEALFELLRGFQTAHDQTNGGLLADVLKNDPNQVYAGLLTVLLRTVFVLYAEDRGLLSSDPLFVNHYSVNGLFQSLRADEARYPDTIGQRFGAWARLLALYRMVWRGARHGSMRIPGRRGYLFDPDRFPFLEGRPDAASAEFQIPRVSDGVVYRVLRSLLILDGERLSYRNLDVEQIGSVYEAMMGFELHVASGPSIAIKPKKRHGAPVTINLEALLGLAPNKRNEWLNKEADHKLTGNAERALKEAQNVDDLMAALDRRIAKNVTEAITPKGSMIFQPSPERRRSGSHYTPRSLTQPIVEAALEPILKKLGPKPLPEQILALRVCDPAMGSGAFLVEACRQLAAALVEAWHIHKAAPPLPPDEDEVKHAQRLIAQRCLYGVDRNEMAADLAKLSLWLTTLARDHEFTFLNHALRHGDSLVGFTALQIAAFHWAPKPSLSFLEQKMRGQIARAAFYRKRILEAREDTPYAQMASQLESAEQELRTGRIAGDLLVAAFFEGEKKPARENARLRYEAELKKGIPVGLQIVDVQASVNLEAVARALRAQAKPIVPFHWELEFPEVFDLDEGLRPRQGFDAVIGNPPFAGKNTLLDGSATGYLDWLKQLHPESHGNSDLVAHFFRRAFTLLKPGGCFGLIATNTIGQGDTRSTGLRWICMHGGTVYRARKRLPWPGEAAVIVSVVHVSKGELPGPYWLDRRLVDRITAYLFHAGGNEDPAKLTENEDKSFQGSIVLGMGFTFDDTDKDGVASPLAEMHRLIAKDPRNAERIFPYMGGEEVNNSPTHSHHRYVINFEDFPLRRQDLGCSWFATTDEFRTDFLRSGIVPLDYPGPVAEDWPDLLRIVEERVKPERMTDGRENYRQLWWRYAERRPGLSRALRDVGHVFAVNCGATPFLAVASLPTRIVYSHTLAVFMLDGWQPFTVLQSRMHEVWTRFMGSSLEDRLRYTPTDCFATFPFPDSYENSIGLEQAGQSYYEFRAELMVRSNEGLTKTYNRFHRPDERSQEIFELRELHDAMDRAVLDAYGWHDLRPVCDFFPEFEEDDDADEADSRRLRIKKYRYRWPDDIHDDVLARLLVLNQQRAAVPRSQPDTPTPEKKRSKKKTIKTALPLIEGSEK